MTKLFSLLSPNTLASTAVGSQCKIAVIFLPFETCPFELHFSRQPSDLIHA